MKIITFNLRYDKPDPGNNSWNLRRKAVATLISRHQPAIVGTQEGQAHQLLDLHRRLPDYQSLGADRDGNGRGEHCAIFYDRRQLDCLDSGNFWLSGTPNVMGSVSSDWENPVPRMATWGIFSSGDGRHRIVVFNTHLDYKSRKARELGAALIRDRLGQMDIQNSLLLLTGDFNAEPESPTRQSFTQPLDNGVQLLDVLGHLAAKEQMTYHEFTGKAIAAVDTIYSDSRLHLKAAKVHTAAIDNIWPSDHYPVIAEF
ncbi:MAG: endonuclease/exonuclease/phosphatase family protein [Limnospira sp.]